MNRVDPSLRDIYELNVLSSLQDQRIVLDQVRRQTKSGIQAIANGERSGMPASASSPGTSASTSSANDDDNAIYNRSPTINHNYYRDNGNDPVVQPVHPILPIQPNSLNPLWVLVPLLILALPFGFWLGWYSSRHHDIVTNPVANPVPSPTPVTGNPGVSYYLDLR